MYDSQQGLPNSLHYYRATFEQRSRQNFLPLWEVVILSPWMWKHYHSSINGWKHYRHLTFYKPLWRREKIRRGPGGILLYKIALWLNSPYFAPSVKLLEGFNLDFPSRDQNGLKSPVPRARFPTDWKKCADEEGGNGEWGGGGGRVQHHDQGWISHRWSIDEWVTEWAQCNESASVPTAA